MEINASCVARSQHGQAGSRNQYFLCISRVASARPRLERVLIVPSEGVRFRLRGGLLLCGHRAEGEDRRQDPGAVWWRDALLRKTPASRSVVCVACCFGGHRGRHVLRDARVFGWHALQQARRLDPNILEAFSIGGDADGAIASATDEQVFRVWRQPREQEHAMPRLQPRLLLFVYCMRRQE